MLWTREAGIHQLLKIALPLIISTGSISVMILVDRIFLSWYSTDSLAAALPAGMLNFTFICFFLGTVSYTNTFIAQYFGAKQFFNIGPAIWQGVYISIIGGMLMPFVGLYSDEIFGIVGHAPTVRQMESDYFKLLNFCAFPFLAFSVSLMRKVIFSSKKEFSDSIFVVENMYISR